MSILIKKNGHVEGPYELRVIQEGLKSCRFRLDDLGCLEGEENWVPLYTLASGAQTSSQSPKVEPKQKSLSPKKERSLSANNLIESAVDGLESSLTKLLADDQKESEVKKIIEKAYELLTPNEKIDYIGIQKKPAINLFPDSIILTNKRLMILRPAAFIGMTFEDHLWKEVADVHMSEQILTATILCTTITGQSSQIDYIPKKQARKIYTYAQDIEERMHEYRRYRMMEERRADAGGLVLQSQVAQPHVPNEGAHIEPSLSSNNAPSNPQDDVMTVLKKLKNMLDAGLIEQAEYDEKKREVLSRM